MFLRAAVAPSTNRKVPARKVVSPTTVSFSTRETPERSSQSFAAETADSSSRMVKVPEL
jgi:hypothetical protein